MSSGAHFAAGELVAKGHYRILRKIGEGTMSDVYAAEGVADPTERVALKFLLPKWDYDEEVLRRFRREASIAQQLVSDFVARFVSAGSGRDDRVWIAFELLEGRSLDRLLQVEGAATSLPFQDVAWMVDHVLQGLGAAHAAGIIHRDIKPGNIFIESSHPARARVLDFGVSKLEPSQMSRTHSTVTVTGATIGTLDYMPPEQMGGAAEVDESADLYALGVVAFRALTGVLPFQGATPTARTEFKRRLDPTTLARATGTRWTAELEEFLATAMARVPSRRYRKAGDARDAWREVVRAVGADPSPGHARSGARDEGYDTSPVSGPPTKQRGA